MAYLNVCPENAQVCGMLSQSGHRLAASSWEGDLGVKGYVYTLISHFELVHCSPIFFFFFCLFLRPLLRHMEVPRLGVESEL